MDNQEIIKRISTIMKKTEEIDEKKRNDPTFQCWSIVPTEDNQYILLFNNREVKYKGSLKSVINYCVDKHLGVDYIIPFKKENSESKSIIPEQFIPGTVLVKLPEYSSLDDKQPHFKDNSIRIVDKVDDLNSFLSEASKHNDFIFRGINEARFKQFSSSQRHWLLYHKIRNELKQDTYSKFINELINLSTSSKELTNFLTNKLGLKNEKNDFLILSILQHYWKPSPLLDFSNDPYKALFFCFDNCKLPSGKDKNELSNYVALYILSESKDLEDCSVNRVYQYAEEFADEQLSDYGHHVNTDEIEQEFENWPFLKLYENAVPFILVDQGTYGISKEACKVLTGDYRVNNTSPRIDAQNGLFILNNSESLPLEEVMERNSPQIKMQCVHINKSLMADAKKILEEKGINKETVYDQPDSLCLQKILDGIIPQDLLDEVSLADLFTPHTP